MFCQQESFEEIKTLQADEGLFLSCLPAMHVESLSQWLLIPTEAFAPAVNTIIFSTPRINEN